MVQWSLELLVLVAARTPQSRTPLDLCASSLFCLYMWASVRVAVCLAATLAVH